MARKKSKLINEGGCLLKMIHLDRVSRARKDAISEKEVGRLALLYKSLADPTRLRIVMALRGGEMCVCDLAALLGLSDSAVSHQIRKLKDLALVKNRRSGQVLYYALDDDHVADLLKVGLAHIRE
ncbi:MAG: helix-turn-helix transcriptional regulator [Deltaproteobacteria bacterium]|nr:helix-turn-helix transcriptional regulator [Deltaproteobacteria bacterium]